MKSRLQAHLQATPQQAERLRRLQEEFAQACNAIAPRAQSTHCWNRVALHHMVYREMRERFPNLGSQMVCNAIYAVSRTCRVVYQGVGSPFHIARVGADALPLIQFMPDAPVYFDRHTLSIRDGQGSLYTLDGRIHFQIQLPPGDLQRLATERLREVVLTGRGSHYTLTFMLDPQATATDSNPEPNHRADSPKRVDADVSVLPGYVQIVPSLPAAVRPASPQELR